MQTVLLKIFLGDDDLELSEVPFHFDEWSVNGMYLSSEEIMQIVIGGTEYPCVYDSKVYERLKECLQMKRLMFPN